MTAFDTGEALACRLTEALRTPVLEGLTPLERLALADGAGRVDGLPGGWAERWWKLSDGERAWLFMCADVRQIAVRCVGVDAALQYELGLALATLGGVLQCTPADEVAAGVEEAARARLDDEPFDDDRYGF